MLQDQRVLLALTVLRVQQDLLVLKVILGLQVRQVRRVLQVPSLVLLDLQVQQVPLVRQALQVLDYKTYLC